MPVNEISLESLGLLTVGQVAESRGVPLSTAQKWVQSGQLPAVPVPGGGRIVAYLVRVADLGRFTPRRRGRPAPAA